GPGRARPCTDARPARSSPRAARSGWVRAARRGRTGRGRRGVHRGARGAEGGPRGRVPGRVGTVSTTIVETEELTYAQALNRALAEEMRRDPRVWIMGQDVGVMGGVFGVTRNLLDEFGEARVRDTAIVETFIVGGAAGAAMTGTVPVV